MKKGTFSYTVTVTAELVSGRESTGDFIAEDIRMQLEDDANPGSVFPDENEYEITHWTVVTRR